MESQENISQVFSLFSTLFYCFFCFHSVTKRPLHIRNGRLRLSVLPHSRALLVAGLCDHLQNVQGWGTRAAAAREHHQVSC